jgi:hypothetical protein
MQKLPFPRPRLRGTSADMARDAERTGAGYMRYLNCTFEKGLRQANKPPPKKIDVRRRIPPAHRTMTQKKGYD